MSVIPTYQSVISCKRKFHTRQGQIRDGKDRYVYFQWGKPVWGINTCTCCLILTVAAIGIENDAKTRVKFILQSNSLDC